MIKESIQDFDEEKARQLRSEYEEAYEGGDPEEIAQAVAKAKLHYLENPVPYKKAAKTEAIRKGMMQAHDYPETYVQNYEDKMKKTIDTLFGSLNNGETTGIAVDDGTVQLVGQIKVGGGLGVVIRKHTSKGETQYWSISDDGSDPFDSDRDVDDISGGLNIYQLKPSSVERALRTVKTDSNRLYVGILEPMSTVDDDILEASEVRYISGPFWPFGPTLDEEALGRTPKTEFYKENILGINDIEAYALVAGQTKNSLQVNYVDHPDTGSSAEKTFAVDPQTVCSYLPQLAARLESVSSK